MYKDRCTKCNDSSTKLQPQSCNDSCNKVTMTKLLYKDSCTLCRTMDRFTMTVVTNLQTVQWQLYKAVQSITVQSCTKVQQSCTKYSKVVQNCLCTKTVV